MATTHEIIAAKDGHPFISVGPVTIKSQVPPRFAKNGRLFGTVVLRSAAGDLLLMLWDGAALTKLPLNKELNLQGAFIKASYNGSAQITSDTLTPPEGASTYEEPKQENQPTNQPTNQTQQKTMTECLEAGLRAVVFVEKKERPDLAGQAFSFAAKAAMDGIKLE